MSDESRERESVGGRSVLPRIQHEPRKIPIDERYSSRSGRGAFFLAGSQHIPRPPRPAEMNWGV